MEVGKIKNNQIKAYKAEQTISKINQSENENFFFMRAFRKEFDFYFKALLFEPRRFLEFLEFLFKKYIIRVKRY